MIYNLYLQAKDPIDKNYLNNKSLLFSSSLEEIDLFTIEYEKALDIKKDFYPHSKVSLDKALIISSRNLKQKKYKEEEILLKKDRQFIEEYYSNNRDCYYEYLKEQYKKYLLDDINRLKTSPIKHVNIGINIVSSISLEDFNKIFYTYYRNRNSYKDMRTLYLILSKTNYIEQKEIKRREKNK